MNSDHLTTDRISGPCAVAPFHLSGDSAHVVGVQIFCREHCPACEEKD